MRIRISTGIVAVATMLTACGDSTAPNTPATNTPPTANAGPDQVVNVGETVQLDGSGSSDPEGSSLTFSWSFQSRPAGSSTTLSNATSSTPTFTPDTGGQYIVQLSVSDGSATSTDDVVVTANAPPTADAGPDQDVNVGETVQLDGSHSSDPEGSSLTYSWSFQSRPAGSNATLSNATSSMPTFTPDAVGEYVVSLTVGDGMATSSPDQVTVTAAPVQTPLFLNFDNSDKVLSNQREASQVRTTIFRVGAPVPLETEWEAVLDNDLDGDGYGFTMWLGAGTGPGQTGTFTIAFLSEHDGVVTELATTTFSVPFDEFFRLFTADVTGLPGGVAGDKITLRATVNGVSRAGFLYGGGADSQVLVPGVVTVSPLPSPSGMPGRVGAQGSQGVRVELSVDDSMRYISRERSCRTPGDTSDLTRRPVPGRDACRSAEPTS